MNLTEGQTNRCMLILSILVLIWKRHNLMPYLTRQHRHLGSTSVCLASKFDHIFSQISLQPDQNRNNIIQLIKIKMVILNLFVQAVFNTYILINMTKHKYQKTSKINTYTSIDANTSCTYSRASLQKSCNKNQRFHPKSFCLSLILPALTKMSRQLTFSPLSRKSVIKFKSRINHMTDGRIKLTITANF